MSAINLLILFLWLQTFASVSLQEMSAYGKIFERFGKALGESGLLDWSNIDFPLLIEMHTSFAYLKFFKCLGAVKNAWGPFRQRPAPASLESDPSVMSQPGDDLEG